MLAGFCGARSRYCYTQDRQISAQINWKVAVHRRKPNPSPVNRSYRVHVTAWNCTVHLPISENRGRIERSCATELLHLCTTNGKPDQHSSCCSRWLCCCLKTCIFKYSSIDFVVLFWVDKLAQIVYTYSRRWCDGMWSGSDVGNNVALVCDTCIYCNQRLLWWWIW